MRFNRAAPGLRHSRAPGESEWLLQVRNDIRVGNWLRLGSPEPGELKPEDVNSNLLTTWLWLATEMNGYFQMTILEALESSGVTRTAFQFEL